MRIERLGAAYDIDIVYRHFPLHPETPDEGLTLEQLFAGRNLDVPRMQAEMARRMADEGLAYGTRTRTYNSRLAQELGCWADTQDGGSRLHDDLFAAYFVDDVNLADLERLVELVDLLPTLCELSAIPIPSQVQGKSLTGVLQDPELPVKRVAYTVVRRGAQLGRAVRAERWRYALWGESGSELYDLRRDPAEFQNLAETGRQQQLERMERLLKAVSEPLKRE